MITATLFDLMGTLLIEDPNSPGDHFASFHRLLSEAGLSMDRDELLRCLNEIQSVAVAGPTTPFEDRLLRMFARDGTTLSAEQTRDLANEICRDSCDVLALDPEAIETLITMRQIGPVGLVSNYDHPPNVQYLLER
ncbi:MAG: hypothetical protein HOB49_06595, partial [Gemmatimonadetes bacterium]|nr:hypothetical protein [Gemmatimonadota bacterium]